MRNMLTLNNYILRVWPNCKVVKHFPDQNTSTQSSNCSRLPRAHTPSRSYRLDTEINVLLRGIAMIPRGNECFILPSFTIGSRHLHLPIKLIVVCAALRQYLNCWPVTNITYLLRVKEQRELTFYNLPRN